MKSKESRDQKDSGEAKKIYNSFATNSNSRNRYKNQSSQILGWFSKKNFYSNQGGQRDQFSNTLVTDNNAITVKKK